MLDAVAATPFLGGEPGPGCLARGWRCGIAVPTRWKTERGLVLFPSLPPHRRVTAGKRMQVQLAEARLCGKNKRGGSL